MKDVTSFKLLGDYVLQVQFESGEIGVVDVSQLVPFVGVFAPLSSPEYFARVQINSEVGTLYWPNGADLDPILLYAEATGCPLPDWATDAVTVT